MAPVKPVISVIIPAYKAARYLHRAVDSLKAQTFTRWEAIIVDDGSPDDTWQTIQKLAKTEKRIKPHRLKQNGGPSVARNTALALASGEYVTILDSDDAYRPDRLETLYKHAKADDLDMLADNLWLFDPAVSQVLRPGFFRFAASRKWRVWDVALLFRYDVPGSWFYMGWLKPMWKTSFLRKNNILYNPALRYGEDFILYAECLAKGAKSHVLDYAGYVYTLPYSVVDKSRQTSSHSVANRDAMIEAQGDWLKRNQGQLSDSDVYWINRRNRCLETFEPSKQKLWRAAKRLDLAGVLKLVFANPYLVRYIAIRAVGHIVVRLRGCFDYPTATPVQR